jgi:hypothetical protein
MGVLSTIARLWNDSRLLHPAFCLDQHVHGAGLSIPEIQPDATIRYLRDRRWNRTGRQVPSWRQ